MKKLLILLLLFATSCHEKFDKKLWNEQNDIGLYSKRNLILNDLVSNHQIKGLSYKQLTDSLGTPNGINNDTLAYNIALEYSKKMDLVYSKHLFIKLNKDSVATGFDVKESRK